MKGPFTHLLEQLYHPLADGAVLTAGKATSEDTRVDPVAREALHYTYMCTFFEILYEKL
jgi:hypothetical protein